MAAKKHSVIPITSARETLPKYLTASSQALSLVFTPSTSFAIEICYPQGCNILVVNQI